MEHNPQEKKSILPLMLAVERPKKQKRLTKDTKARMDYISALPVNASFEISPEEFKGKWARLLSEYKKANPNVMFSKHDYQGNVLIYRDA